MIRNCRTTQLCSFKQNLFHIEGAPKYDSRGVIKGKEGKAAALPYFSDTLTLSQSRGADYAQPLAFPHLNYFRD